MRVLVAVVIFSSACQTQARSSLKDAAAQAAPAAGATPPGFDEKFALESCTGLYRNRPLRLAFRRNDTFKFPRAAVATWTDDGSALPFFDGMDAKIRSDYPGFVTGDAVCALYNAGLTLKCEAIVVYNEGLSRRQISFAYASASQTMSVREWCTTGECPDIAPNDATGTFRTYPGWACKKTPL